MIFRPDIKPPMLGPPEVVQYAVRANAERMDVGDVKGLFPFWERAGNIASNVATGVPHTWSYGWTNDGIDCVTTGNNFLLSVSDTNIINLPLSNFSCFVWCTPNFYATDRSVLSWGGTDDLIIYPSDTGVSGQRVFWRDCGSNVVSYSGGSKNGVPTFLGFTSKSGQQKFFIDGVLRSTNTVSTSTSGPFSSFTLGGWADSVQPFGGIISQCLLVASEVAENVVSQLAATPYALLMPVSRPVYSFPATGGGTLTTDSAWKIYTAAEIDTAWSIRAALSQSAAWAVFTRADAESAWSIRTSSEAETAWTVRAGLDTPTAWPIATAADTPTEWRIKAGLDAETAWPIFTSVDTATAWAILDSLALETPTAWSIRNALAADAAWSIRAALDTGSAWAILTRLDRETAWQILGAGILDTPTAWAIRADLDQATAWTIKTSLDQSTDWTIINGMDTATAWDILQGFATDTAWHVFRDLDTATAWAIISDTVPEPVRVFMAERRDFIINAEKRIFILLAERK